jgi:hypothetical protein
MGGPSGFSFGLAGFESSSRDVVAGAPTNQKACLRRRAAIG